VIDMSQTNESSPVITKYPDAPMPTPFTRFNRHNLLIQVPKFVIMCANIMMMVLKGHDKD